MLNDVPLPTHRSFGRLFTIVFALLAGWAWWRGRTSFVWLAATAILFAIVTLVRPDWLAPLNRAWMAFAQLLNRIVSPIVLGVLFFLVVAPFGLVMRLAGRDPMRRKFDPAARSYWIERQPPGPPPESLKDQF